MHAPQTAMPQPNWMPVKPSSSRNAYNSGVSGVADNRTVWPLSEVERRSLPAQLKVAGGPVDWNLVWSHGRIIASIAADGRAGAEQGRASCFATVIATAARLAQGLGADVDRAGGRHEGILSAAASKREPAAYAASVFETGDAQAGSVRQRGDDDLFGAARRLRGWHGRLARPS
ncbi:MAG: hypothetical protein IPJ97_18525 [Proteobacteria bacterium]|nr:hypothetical protein [Pseudomonadota bacterium]